MVDYLDFRICRHPNIKILPIQAAEERKGSEVPTSTTGLRIQYLDRDPEPDVEIGAHTTEIELSAGQTLTLTDPAIDLAVFSDDPGPGDRGLQPS